MLLLGVGYVQWHRPTNSQYLFSFFALRLTGEGEGHGPPCIPPPPLYYAGDVFLKMFLSYHSIPRGPAGGRWNQQRFNFIMMASSYFWDGVRAVILAMSLISTCRCATLGSKNRLHIKNGMLGTYIRVDDMDLFTHSGPNFLKLQLSDNAL